MNYLGLVLWIFLLVGSSFAIGYFGNQLYRDWKQR